MGSLIYEVKVKVIPLQLHAIFDETILVTKFRCQHVSTPMQATLTGRHNSFNMKPDSPSLPVTSWLGITIFRLPAGCSMQIQTHVSVMSPTGVTYLSYQNGLRVKEDIRRQAAGIVMEAHSELDVGQTSLCKIRQKESACSKPVCHL
jgi:hypothetical protein